MAIQTRKKSGETQVKCPKCGRWRGVTEMEMNDVCYYCNVKADAKKAAHA